ncbi:cbb3-type cytochrome c oxidase N-terminal domain-containing protein [Sediminibacterium goheungense]|uniref:Cytochrome c oxidase cbb3-type subunit 3 n=1 Tax=Sediminibacterium goheungense TaxID=1086393 RepID=A0A4R6IV02_9BACT|nr:cbb3-type cytochrome c oxidase N-terminal domain-containing protein [Sediminibacterium goheungense]TDO26432.1 cytochrome c oxidase cbb3-type subunit 3 [Sediminibacterium goheungense]
MQQRNFQRIKLFSIGIIGLFCVLVPSSVWAEGPPKPSAMANPLAQVLVVIIAVLLLAIALLSHVVLGAAEMKMKEFREKRKSDAQPKVLMVIVFLLTSSFAFAADEPASSAPVSSTISGLSPTAFYSLISVVGVELLVLLWLLYHLKSLLAKEKPVVIVAEKESAITRWWTKANNFKPVQEEATIDLGHDYDGIRELDNRLPPWWLYGFYICIIFAGIYLWRYHVTHTAPSSLEELAAVMKKAEADKENYLKKAANNVNENTVTYLSDATALEAGKKIFVTACAACHAADGGGLVGPNLVDEYWLHGGSVSDIFKSIKYGWPEKGMKSWKDDYSPAQIAQLASYIKSLKGTRPATAKEPQGEIYKEQSVSVDSLTKESTVIKSGLK